MPRKSTSTPSITYGIHPSVTHAQSIIANMPDKTGKSLDQWVKLLNKSGPKLAARDTSPKAIRERGKQQKQWLKNEHNIGAVTAMLIVQAASDNDEDAMATDPETYLKQATRYVDNMYAGPKTNLRAIHDALINMGIKLGKDVKVCPCKTIVPLYREHVFAEIKPSTRTRIDLGLALTNCAEATKAAKSSKQPLIDTGGAAKGDRITHRIPINALDDVDNDVQRWLQTAYELDAD